ncbi:hypothetical protein EsH8_III_000098 [Colletotrichum jinshuiense]
MPAEWGIIPEDFLHWNSGVDSSCDGLWADVNVCVSVIGQATTPAQPTTRSSGMATNCKTFHFVQAGDTCEAISRARGITIADFVK